MTTYSQFCLYDLWAYFCPIEFRLHICVDHYTNYGPAWISGSVLLSVIRFIWKSWFLIKKFFPLSNYIRWVGSKTPREWKWVISWLLIGSNTKTHFSRRKIGFYRQIFYMFERRPFFMPTSSFTHFEPPHQKLEKRPTSWAHMGWFMMTSRFFWTRKLKFGPSSEPRTFIMAW